MEINEDRELPSYSGGAYEDDFSATQDDDDDEAFPGFSNWMTDVEDSPPHEIQSNSSEEDGRTDDIDQILESIKHPKRNQRTGSKNLRRGNVKNIILFEKLGLYGIIFVVYLTVTILVTMGTADWLPMVDAMFGLYMLIFFGSFGIIAVVGGSLVEYWGMRVMFSRKTIHICSFFNPFILFILIPFDKNLTTYSLTCCALFLAYAPLIEPCRKSSKLLNLAYKSFDRKQDHPFTLFWAVSQSFFAFVVMIPIGIFFSVVLDQHLFVCVPVMTVAFGDGLAEIVGKLFGNYAYKTKAIFTQKEYTRTIEGSLCVFFSCIITILVIVYCLSDPIPWNTFQVVIACLIIPMSMTIVEAIAPHSWDNALLLLSGGIMTILIFFLPGGKGTSGYYSWFFVTLGDANNVGDESTDFWDTESLG